MRLLTSFASDFSIETSSIFLALRFFFASFVAEYFRHPNDEGLAPNADLVTSISSREAKAAVMLRTAWRGHK